MRIAVSHLRAKPTSSPNDPAPPRRANEGTRPQRRNGRDASLRPSSNIRPLEQQRRVYFPNTPSSIWLLSSPSGYKLLYTVLLQLIIDTLVRFRPSQLECHSADAIHLKLSIYRRLHDFIQRSDHISPQYATVEGSGGGETDSFRALSSLGTGKSHRNMPIGLIPSG
jgi:hypothetical protein